MIARIALRHAEWTPQRIALAAVLAGWLCICALAVSKELMTLGFRGLIVAAVVVLAPLIVLNIARFPVYVFCVYAILVPFNDLLNTSSGPTVTRLLAIATSGCLLFAMFLKGKIAAPSRALFVLIALTAYLGATVFWAIDPPTALAAYAAYLSYIGFFAIVALFPFSEREVKLVLLAALIGALAQSVYGDVLFLHGQYLTGSRLYIGVTAEHSIDPNAFATSLLVPIAVLLSLFLRVRFGIAKVFWLALLTLVFIGFLASGSRGAAFGFAAMVIFLMIRRPQYRTTLLAIIGIAAAVMFTSPIGMRFMQSDISSADGRFDIWKVGLAALHQYWLTGAGIGNFNNAFTQYYFATPHVWLSWDRVAHSILLQSAVEYGVIGFGLLMTFWYLQFRELAYVRTPGAVSDVCVALCAGVLGVFVSGLSLNLMEYKNTWLLFCLIAMSRNALQGMGVTPTPDVSGASRLAPLRQSS